ncbi:hypothetical protein EXU57_15775 [Segetibacter sp. 3557_3]|uniref:hypothetical protein n=1 Tax=Segetibacter sp. 3557_3 TaxID=2547429 RepID=UPI0010585CA2|nr:hypothetical protein [Segetibacter sp. 3557_3]TDH23952.1 hypothetical protein EXU57_15775 [Segetibacter sp. 3557_3]
MRAGEFCNQTVLQSKFYPEVEVPFETRRFGHTHSTLFELSLLFGKGCTNVQNISLAIRKIGSEANRPYKMACLDAQSDGRKELSFKAALNSENDQG